MRESPYPMIPVDEALEQVMARVAPLPTVERRFDESAGWVLAEPVVAREPLPPFPASTVDGFAVRAADGAARRALVGERFAGTAAPPLRVGPGEAARITTGAPLPPGADAVMMVEWSDERDGTVAFDRAVGAGDYIRPVGSDIAVGATVLKAGRSLGPAEIGVLATVGALLVTVHRRPVVGVMSTGDELVEPDHAPGPGQIRDANRYSLMAAAREAGAVVRDLGVAPDERPRLEAFLAAGMLDCDLLLTSGGVSMGERDLVKPLLAERGEIHFGRVFMKPGKPVTFATLEERPFLALPGNPVSSLVGFEIFVRPALRKMRGLPPDRWQRPRLRATLEHPIRHTGDRTEYQRARLTYDPERGRFSAATTGAQQSSRLLSMVGAEALLILPHGAGDFAAGDEVEVIQLGEAI